MKRTRLGISLYREETLLRRAHARWVALVAVFDESGDWIRWDFVPWPR